PATENGETCDESALLGERVLSNLAGQSAVALPLCFGEEKLGLGFFEFGTRDGTVYEALRAQISAALEAIAHGVVLAEFCRERDQFVEQAAVQLAELRSSWRAARALSDTEPSSALSGSLPELSRKLSQLECTLDALLELRAPDTLRAASRNIEARSVRDADSQAPEHP